MGEGQTNQSANSARKESFIHTRQELASGAAVYVYKIVYLVFGRVAPTRARARGSRASFPSTLLPFFFSPSQETSGCLFLSALLVGDGVKGVPSVAPPSVVSDPSGPESWEEDQGAKPSKAGLLRVATARGEEARADAKGVRTLIRTAP